MKTQRTTLPELVLDALADFPLTKVDVGGEAVMKKNGFHFQTEAYEAEGLGHIGDRRPRDHRERRPHDEPRLGPRRRQGDPDV